MTATPPIPAPDDKDWTWVLERPCPDCGYDAGSVSGVDLPPLILHNAAALRAALDRPDARRRPAPEVWSPLEYACHVRDVCRVFGARLSLMRGTDNPSFPNWDQDETALAEQYWAQDPVEVAVELDEESARIAADFASVTGDEWQRPGRRSNGSVFTVDTLGRYFAHDLVHHVHDIG
ncbi:DinB family protein [Jatrophihabitans sp.]|uniref:DinB family protein n=1 Tax=Jatrophihabitans sp. TaxID=1932789 RepID=UPI0030C701BF|nr:hypothetical protein [Jatrophihabitans sp.]